MADVLAIVLAYLWGAVPIVYIAARLRKGIDIRQYGTGNVGASNAISQLGKRTGIVLGLLDGFAKGTLPVVAAKLSGLDLGVQMGIALAAVVGHNWSPYLKFTGGRGVAAAMGAYVGFGLWPQLVLGIVLVGVIGWLIRRNLALWMVIGMGVMAPFAYVLGQPVEVVLVLLGLVVLVVLKRLTGNWERPLAGEPAARVFLYRLLYDRDVSDRDEWTRRMPSAGPGQIG